MPEAEAETEAEDERPPRSSEEPALEVVSEASRLRRRPRVDAARSRSRSPVGSAPASPPRSSAFAHHGAATVSSDEIVHHLLATDPDVKQALVERLGEEILGDDGNPDRGAHRSSRLRRSSGSRLPRAAPASARLARVPGLARAARRRFDEPPAVCVTEVPLLYEVGAEERFDKVVVVTAPPKLREHGVGAARRPRGQVAPRPREGRNAPTSPTSTPGRPTSSTRGWWGSWLPWPRSSNSLSLLIAK